MAKAYIANKPVRFDRNYKVGLSAVLTAIGRQTQ